MHIVYKLTFQNRKSKGVLPHSYIGSKSNAKIKNGIILDNNNKPYYGSSRCSEFAKAMEEEKPIVELLYSSKMYEEVLNREKEIHIDNDVVANTEYFNLSIATVNYFTTPGYGTFKHSVTGKCVRLPTNHPRVLSKEYVGATTGYIMNEEIRKRIGRRGKLNPFYGRKHTPESIEKMSQIKRGKKASNATRQKMSIANSGKVSVRDSNGNCLRVSVKDPRYLNKELTHFAVGVNVGKVVLIHADTGETIQIHRDDKAKLKDLEKWLNPAAYHSLKGTYSQYTCPYCGKTGAASIMKRWHGEKCKHKLKQNES